MRIGFEVTVFPTKLLQRYKNLEMSDNDLLNVLAFFSFDTDLEKAAKIRGYSSTPRMRAAMQHLFDKGLIVEKGNTWDFSPLLAACDGTRAQGIFVLQEGKKPVDRAFYQLYAQVADKVADNKHAWATFFKEMAEAGNSIEDVVACIEYIAAYYASNDKDVVRTVYISTVRRNFPRWVEKGKPRKFEEVNVNTIMEMLGGS